MQYETIKTTIPINVEITKTPHGYVGKIDHHDSINGCITQGDTEEEVKKRLSDLLTFMLTIQERERKEMTQLAIFVGRWGGSNKWFRIIGVGVNLYVKPTGVKIPNQRPLLFGKYRITFLNIWKTYNK